jgi:Flp pilus assembly protein TadB
LQNIALVTSVARRVVSSPTPAIHLGYGETMASIGQGVVGEAHCISLVEGAAEQMLEPIDIVPALQRGWAWWCAGAVVVVVAAAVVVVVVVVAAAAVGVVVVVVVAAAAAVVVVVVF